MAATHGAGTHSHTRTYLAVFLVLLILLAVTVIAAQFDVGRWNLPAASAIATAKAALIVLYFMHVRYSSSLIWLFAAAGFVWLAILFGLTLNDYLTRG
jgi:cytochrome c oxidase subunit 4